MEPFGVQKRVCAEIDGMKEEIIQTLQELVRIPSVVGHEEEAQKFMEQLYRSLGLKVICLAPDLEEVEIIGRAGGLDSRFSQYFNMAAACTGPRTNNIHGIDEYVEIPSVIQVTQVLAMASLEWCGTKESPLPHSAIESV